MPRYPIGHTSTDNCVACPDCAGYASVGEHEKHHLEPMMDQATIQLVALHKHWIAADSVNYHLRRSARVDEADDAGFPKAFEDMAKAMTIFSALGVWYSLLQVVVEGYVELRLRDEKLDEILSNSDNVKALRRFRNATFHYQEDPLSQKILEFILADGSEVWINDLNRAFKSFFERQLNLQAVVAAIVEAGGGLPAPA